MKHFFNSILLLLIACTAYNQPIYYSSNKLTHSTNYQYKIIGNINDNTIVWKTFLNKKQHSEIYVYDHSLQLIKKVKTDILSSSTEPLAQFYNAGNIFYVAYQYKKQRAFMYRLASFDASGDLITIKNLDSLHAGDSSVINQTFFYRLMQSANGKTICFNKMSYDSVHYVLKFNCSFITGNEIRYKDFVIPFNPATESLADIIVDNEKNVLLLKSSKKDKLVNLSLIKQNFASNEMLTTDKSIDVHAFEDNSLRILEKSGSYLVFGRFENDSTHLHRRALYVWQTDDALNDFSGDTIINRLAGEKRLGYTASINAGNKFENVFASWNVDEANYPAAQRNNTNQSPVNNYSGSTSLSSYSAFDHYPINNEVDRTITGIYLTPYYNYNPNDNNYTRSYPTSPVTNVNFSSNAQSNLIELFMLDSNNKILWNNNFSDSIDNYTEANLMYAKVIGGNSTIHIICEIVTNKKTKALDHIAVKPDGSFTRGFFTAWDTKYDYNLDDCVLTDKNELIIPATNGVKIKFVKIRLD